MTKTIEYKEEFSTNVAELFNVFVDDIKHTEFSGAPSEIDPKVGGKFTAYGGALSGEFTKLVKNKEISQTWRAGDWPENYFSEVQYLFKPKGDKTEITFRQTNVPDEFFEKINQGWQMMYWDKLKEYFS